MELKENRECKNSVFVDLFYEDETAEENDIALYNALHDEPLPPGTKVEKIRVHNELYMNFKNDVSFGIGGKLLVFAEHQSTVNENMPLRSLLYLGRAYEQLVPVRKRYRKRRVPIPKPEVYTFYNGKEKWEKEKILKLSDAFIMKDSNPAVELKVKVININPDQNHEVLDRCKVLKEYSIFMDTIRKYQESGDEEPYRKAIEECIEKNVLADYLRKKGSEVVNMLMSEYNYEDDIAEQREEAYEEGKKAGRELGISEGEERYSKLLIKLTAEGKTDEILKVARDSEFREKLYKEYGL